MKTFDEYGREIPDPRPVEIPDNYKRPPTLREQIQQAIRQEFSRVAAQHGAETFEEADDFDIEDDEPRSQWELDDDQYSARFEEAADATNPPGGTAAPVSQRSGNDAAGAAAVAGVSNQSGNASSQPGA